MDSFIKETTNQLPGYRQLSNSSAKSYSTCLNSISKLCTGEPYTNPEFLKDYDGVLSTLTERDYKQSTVAGKIGAILVALSPRRTGVWLEGYEIVGDKYRELFKKLKNEIKSNAEKQEKSDTDKSKWTTIKTLINIKNKIGRDLKAHGIVIGKEGITRNLFISEKKLLQQYLVATLYTSDFTNRNVYGCMEIISGDQWREIEKMESPPHKNYLVMDVVGRKRELYFQLGDTKTSMVYSLVASPDSEPDIRVKHWTGYVKIDVPDKLNKPLDLWLKYHPGVDATGIKWLLLNTKHEPHCLGNNGLTKLITSTFKSTGKNIGSTIIRKIMNSEKFGNDSKFLEKKEVAIKCGHSVQCQQLHYTKFTESKE